MPTRTSKQETENLPLSPAKRSGTQDKSPRPYEIAHGSLARQIAAEGIVLLKNEDHLLPLKENCKIALYGAVL
ncbi:MAG: hypothetical protein IKF90_22700 [Parasporobacterium sp.]|nr:hypothetical protein [Parasporobacterium sp.]